MSEPTLETQDAAHVRKVNFCPRCGYRVSGKYCLNCGKKLYHEHASPQGAAAQREEPKEQATPKPKSTILKRVRTAVAVTVACLVVALVWFWPQISGWELIRTSDPTMVSLANEAGMNFNGKVKFLRTHPELVTDSEMTTDCAENAAANNSNGFIEQGCYVPDKNNPATGQIYIREMPQDFHSLEVSTASYEMLHAVYLSEVESGQKKTLDAAIEANYQSLVDDDLRTQVAGFAKTEPNDRDLELFSLLLTGYSGVTSDLTAYADPYFDDLNLTVEANQQALKVFQDDETKLAQLQTSITNWANSANQALALANTAYRNSVSWAEVGNAYQNDRNYNIYVQDYNAYSQDIDQENSAIDQYNATVQHLNILIPEYQGTQPVKEIQSAQAGPSNGKK
jgi:hypothetical protein